MDEFSNKHEIVNRYKWSMIEYDCPILVRKWLAKSYNLNTTEITELNKSNGASTIDEFINPYYIFADQNQKLETYNWCVSVIDTSSLDADIPISIYGPTDDYPYCYNPILLYIIGKNKGVKFDVMISDVDIMHYMIDVFKSREKSYMTHHEYFDTKVSMNNYTMDDLRRFMSDVGYSKLYISKYDKQHLYDKLYSIYTDYMFKYQGCICIYAPGANTPNCYIETDLVSIFTQYNSLINPITHAQLSSEQIRQLLQICKQYRLHILYKFMMEQLQNVNSIYVARDSFIKLISNNPMLDKVNLLLELSKAYDYIKSKYIQSCNVQSLYEVYDYFNNIPYVKSLIVVSNGMVLRLTIHDLLYDDSDVETKMKLLKNTLEYYVSIDTM